LGGMQALQWAIHYPDRVRHCVAIATASKLSAQNIAFNEVARQAIVTDPDFHNGDYAAFGVIPKRGLGLARMVGHSTYLSADAIFTKFGRELRSGRLDYGLGGLEPEVESSLRHEGQQFSDRLGANTHLFVAKPLDYSDAAHAHADTLAKALAPVTAR